MYQVYDNSKQKVVQSGFKSRQEAKVLRDEKNGEKLESYVPGLVIERFVVNKDKEHPNYDND